MKRFLGVLVILAVVLGAWYAVWCKALNSLELALREKTTEFENVSPEVSISTDYTLKPYGFPFKAGFVVDSLNLSMEDTSTNTTLNLSMTGENRIYVSFLSLISAAFTQNVQFTNSLSNFEGVFEVKDAEESHKVGFNIVRSLGKGSLGESFSYQGITSDIDFYLSMEGLSHQRLLTVNNMETDISKSLTSALLNIRNHITLSGITFFDFAGENSLTLDKLSWNLHLNNFPYSEKLKDIFNEYNRFEGEYFSTSSLKEELVSYIIKMSELGSELVLENYEVEMNGFKGVLSGLVKVNENYKPVGKVSIELNNVDVLLEGDVSRISPLAAMAMGGMKTVSVNLESDGDVVLFNGLPIFTQVPSLVDIVNFLPNEIHRDALSEKTPVLTEKMPVKGAENVTQTISETAMENVQGLDVSPTYVPESLPAAENVVEVENVLDISVTAPAEAVSNTQNQ